MARKHFTTSLDVKLIKEIKKLAIDLDRTVNDLLEEGIRFLLGKYGKKIETEDSGKRSRSKSDGTYKRVVKRSEKI